jgi:hypothetical protein
MEVLKAINAVQAALVMTGISKDKKNQMQGYNFRGIDDMYNALAPLLAKAKLVVLPSYSDRNVVERRTDKDKALFYVTLRGEFTFRSTEDQSEVKVSTYGEAMDSGDKATNKAMSAALKYAFMQTFTIPTEGDNDTENHTVEVKHAAMRPGDGAGKISPTTGAWDAIPIDMQNMMLDNARRVSSLLKKKDLKGAVAELTEAVSQFDGRVEYMTAQWTCFESNERSALKANGFHFTTEKAAA